MLCYFPFTYISDELIGTLTRSLGPLAVYQGLEQRVPEHMREWASRSLLEVRLPNGVDQSRLHRVLKEYQAWAELHQGRMVDLSAFWQNTAKGAPLVDETNPTQISSQVRSHGQAPVKVDPLFQASLFLVISQEYDIHQETLARELGAVQRLEQQMFSHLDGATPEPGQVGTFPQDPGLYMTDARIHSWALLAECDPQPSWGFITTSRAVLDVILDKLPQARQLLQWNLGTEDLGVADDAAIAIRRDFLRDLAFSRDPWAVPVPDRLQPAGSANGQRLTFYGVPGLPPPKVLSTLCRPAGLDRSDSKAIPEPQNTLIGIISPIQHNNLI